VRRVEYADFDLLVQRAGGGFEARVLHSPVGETGMVPFPDPFSALELENFLLKIGRPRSAARGLGSAESSAVRDFGGRLFEGVFRGEVRDCLVSSLNQAEGRGVGLRLRLRLADCPALADLPWECLYDAGRRRHLALSGWTPLIRYLDLPGVVRPLDVTPPLRMLVLIASPTDYDPLDVEREFENLHRAVDSLAVAGRLVVDRLSEGTLAALQQQLRREDYHVFHYVGHGGYDATADDGVLVLEGPEGRGQQVSAQDLATLLCDYRTLRLVVLNSCEGARSGLADPYGGTAQTLIQQGVPAVVAMQFEITDKAAIDFSQTFYAALSDGYPIEAATAEARKTVKNSPNPVEWATPVLYLRAPDGHLFNFAEPSPHPSLKPAARDQTAGPSSAGGETARPRADATADPRYLEGVAAFYAGRWQDAVDRLAAVQADHPADPQVGRRLVEARRHRDLAAMYARGIEAAERGDWDDAVAAFEGITETDSAYQDAVEQLQRARWERRRHSLVEDLRRLYAGHQWAAVIAAGRELAALNPADADPDGFVTQARDALEEEKLATRYAAGVRQLDTNKWIDALDTFNGIERDRPGYRDTATFLAAIQRRHDEEQRQQRIGELQGALRRQSQARDWAAVVGTSGQLAALDPAAADPDGLASQAREALATQLDGEAREAVADQRVADHLKTARRPAAHQPRILTPTYVPEPGSLQVGQRAQAIAISDDGTRLATGTGQWVRIWDLRTRATVWVQQIGDSPHSVTAVAFSPDGARLATGSLDKTARIWDAATGEQQVQVSHKDKVLAVAFSPDGARLATGCDDSSARIWDAATGAQQLQVSHKDKVLAVAFSPDGARLATGCDDSSARIWDAATGEEQLQVGCDGPVEAVAFSPDGTRLATGSIDSARIWDAVTGKQQLKLKRSLWTPPFVTAVAFSPDGAQLATGSLDETARIWDAATGEQQLQVRCDGSVLAVAFSPDGTRLVTGSADKTVRIWDIAIRK
jgi:hypothetical protein